MKKLFIVLLAALALMMPVFANGAQEAAAPAAAASTSTVEWPKVMTLGTAGTGGAYYSTGVTLGTLFEKYLPTKVSVEITGGALENPVLMSQGELDIAFTNEHIGYFAENQMSPYEGQELHFKALSAGLQGGVIHFCVAGNSDIQSPADLKGKVVAVGTQGNGSLSTIKAVLGFYGLTFDDFTPSYMNYTEGCQGIIDGTVDCSIVPAGIPVSSVQQLAASGKPYRILDMPNREGFLETSPFYQAFDIPANTYPGQTEVVHTLATANIIIVREDMSDAMAYELTKTIYEHLDEIYTAIPNLKNYLYIENALNTVVSVHPGAMKYYQEVGIAK